MGSTRLRQRTPVVPDWQERQLWAPRCLLSERRETALESVILVSSCWAVRHVAALQPNSGAALLKSMELQVEVQASPILSMANSLCLHCIGSCRHRVICKQCVKRQDHRQAENLRRVVVSVLTLACFVSCGWWLMSCDSSLQVFSARRFLCEGTSCGCSAKISLMKVC